MIQELIKLARLAGKKILEVYEQENEVAYKEDNSPLTKADKLANEIIIKGLEQFNIPVISEENKEIPYDNRKHWDELFLVDPLDGTKEFIKKNGEFTINIALIKGMHAVMGVVHAPTLDVTYYSDGKKSYKIHKKLCKELPIEKNEHEPMRVVASRSHFTEETKNYIESIGKRYELVHIGSSLKICLVAEGSADIYPRLGPTMEWDTAAAHAIMKTAGKTLVNLKGEEIQYNKKSLHNEWFIAQ